VACNDVALLELSPGTILTLRKGGLPCSIHIGFSLAQLQLHPMPLGAALLVCNINNPWNESRRGCSDSDCRHHVVVAQSGQGWASDSCIHLLVSLTRAYLDN
jgi:hypothetical protein